MKNTTSKEAPLQIAYVYEIRVDGVVRYIGKGRNGRVYSHLIDAKRTATKQRVVSQFEIPEGGRIDLEMP